MTRVRVGFALRPTGALRVGGARTALFSWLFARRFEGSVVLQVVDTDAANGSAIYSGRGSPSANDSTCSDASVPKPLQYEAMALRDLAWLGLDWDEGPDVGGARGPYRRSERADLYREGANELLIRGLAYRCFCGKTQLEIEEAEPRADASSPCHSGRCGELSKDESDRRADDGESFAVVLRTPATGEIAVDDLVRGRVSMGMQMIGDFVLLHSNGSAAADFAAVVDASLMGITHVIGDEGELPGALRQVLLCGAMGISPPLFAHLPPILDYGDSEVGEDCTTGAIASFRESGYLPEALFNCLALLGWCPEHDREVIDGNELAECFSLERVSPEPTSIDPEKLKWMNAHYMRSLPEERFWKSARAFVPRRLIENSGETKVKEAALLLRRRAGTLLELKDKIVQLLEHHIGNDAARMVSDAGVRELLSELEEALKGERELTAVSFRKTMNRVGKARGIEGKSLFTPVRAAIFGRLEGLEVGEAAALLGAREVRRRIAAALSLIRRE